MAETAAPTARPDERLVHTGALSRLLTRPDIGAFIGAVAVYFAFGYFARGVTGSAIPRSRRGGPTRRRNTGSSPCPWRC